MEAAAHPTAERSTVQYVPGQVLTTVSGWSILPPSLAFCDHPSGGALFQWLFVEAERRSRWLVCRAVLAGQWQEALTLARWKDGAAYL